MKYRNSPPRVIQKFSQSGAPPSSTIVTLSTVRSENAVPVNSMDPAYAAAANIGASMTSGRSKRSAMTDPPLGGDEPIRVYRGGRWPTTARSGAVSRPVAAPRGAPREAEPGPRRVDRADLVVDPLSRQSEGPH